jgi:hypothetical protein
MRHISKPHSGCVNSQSVSFVYVVAYDNSNREMLPLVRIQVIRLNFGLLYSILGPFSGKVDVQEMISQGDKDCHTVEEKRQILHARVWDRRSLALTYFVLKAAQVMSLSAFTDVVMFTK